MTLDSACVHCAMLMGSIKECMDGSQIDGSNCRMDGLDAMQKKWVVQTAVYIDDKL